MTDKTKLKNKDTNIQNSSLGQRVRDLRNKKGWTQTDLANMAGVTYQNIQFCENDKIKMPRYINELAESLGTSIEYLVKGEEEPNVVHIQQHISIVSVDTPVKPDPNYDYHLVKIKKNEPLFVPKGAEIVGQVNKVFVGHTN
jgi:transcriptional regulator with XRE-family HTH domain